MGSKRSKLAAIFMAAAMTALSVPAHSSTVATDRDPATSSLGVVDKGHINIDPKKFNEQIKTLNMTQDERAAKELRSFGLPEEYDERSLQRLLQMAGYDIGSIDGKVGPKTLGDGVQAMLKKYEDKFDDLYEGKAEDLDNEELKALAPAVYKRAAAIGIGNVQANPACWIVYVRAVDSDTQRGRVVVQGEFIVRAPDGRELFMVEKDGEYTAEAMLPEEMEARKAKGENIFRPQFNSGGLNFGRNGMAFKKASQPWNPYAGSALPGFAGGTVYKLEVNDDGINIKGAFKRTYSDLDGFGTFIRMVNLDNEVMNGRDRFGIHVDGDTLTKGKANDGTAGCLGVKEEYAREFFAFIKDMTDDEAPTRVVVLPPADPEFAPKHDKITPDPKMEARR